MSKISLKPNDSGTGNFTIEAPNSNTDRTFSLPDASGGIATTESFSVTITGSDGTSDWVGTDPYVATLTVSGLQATDSPIIDLDLSSVAFSNVDTVQSDYASVYRVETSAVDEIKFYATAEPASDLPVQIKVIR